MRKIFLVVDPCYIVPDKDWKEFLDANEKTGGIMPQAFVTQYGENGIIHRCEDTPNGDGAAEWEGQAMAVDAGMLCVAEIDANLADDESRLFICNTYGECSAQFDTLEQALAAFPEILKLF